MDIEQAKIDGLLKLVQEAYPNWPDVDDPHLRAAIHMAGRLLSQAELDRLLSAGQYDEIMKRLGDVAQAGEVLFLPGPKQGDLDILQQVTDPPGFCQALVDLLYGPGPSTERLRRYSTYVTEHGLPNRWAFPTYFLFVCHPDTEMVVQPADFFRWFLVDYLEVESEKWKWWPTPGTYAVILEAAQALKTALQAHGLRDMADIYTFIRAARYSAEARQVAPGIITHLSKMFADPGEAEWAFDLFAKTLQRLGVTTPNDPRFAIITSKYRGNWQLHLFYSINNNWIVFGFAGQYSALKSVHGSLLLEQGGTLEGIAGVPISDAQSFEEKARGLYERNLALALAGDPPKAASLERKNNNWFVAEALFDPDRRKALAAALFDSGQRQALLESLLPPLEARPPQPPSPAGEEVEPSAEYYGPEDFLAETYLKPEVMEDLLALLKDKDKRQIILYGPPGTGKTFVAQKLARLLTGLREPPPERMEIIQFHPSYSYEDFIEGIRPQSKEAGDGRFVVDYPIQPGVFRRFCEQAKGIDGPCVFIIDEINRGNIPRIFGELMFSLEYRDREVTLPYSGERFRIPENVYLIGTMNTADRSIALVDFALRRRFHFFRFNADPDLLDRWLAKNPVQVTYLSRLYHRLTEGEEGEEGKKAIDDPDFAIGHSHFMKPGLTEEQLERIWRHSIEPYLEEYYIIDNPDRAKEWKWDGELVKGIRSQG